MSRPIPAEQASAILAAVADYPNGASYLDVAALLQSTPKLRNLQRWLAVLVRQKRLVRSGRTWTTRYKLPPAGSSNEPASFASPAGQAIHRLVTQPIGERMPADYRRVTLEAYRPNETWYLSAERRAAARATGPDPPANLPVTEERSSGDVSGATSASRAGTAPDRALTSLASCASWLENATDATKPYAVGAGSRRSSAPGMSSATPLTDAEIIS